MSPKPASFNDVSDTALWVAHYRAEETARPNPLFRDPLAAALVGERGRELAESMRGISQYTAWTVVMRTLIIDRFIETLIGEGIDTIVNLGAGLDTRPYRMNLPKNIRWIEVDYPHLIRRKTELLSAETPVCTLRRVELDLADDVSRRAFFREIGTLPGRAFVITEGVIPYLTESQVATLAQELRAQPRFEYWTTEYLSPFAYRFLKDKRRTAKMKNTPFRFFPEDWIGLFGQEGWVPQKIDFIGEESIKRGRPIPMPWWSFFFKIFFKKTTIDRAKKMSGFVLWKKK